MSNKRILEYSETSTITNDDYLYMDGQTNGSRKIKPNAVVQSATVFQNLSSYVNNDLANYIDDAQDDIADLRADLGDLTDLDTTDKSSIVNAINEVAGGSGSGVPTTVRSAMLALFEAAAYAETGLTDEIAVIESWAEAVTSITLNNSTISISGSGTSQLTATTVPSGATVSWSSSNTAIATVSSAGLVTGVSNGTATITASAGDMSATCTATVSGFATLTSISAVYTQSGTVYDTDTLDSLKTDLVVTAHYDNSTTSTVASTDYTLSGTLTTGTSTITVSYGGKTTTFNVTVTHLQTSETFTFNVSSAQDAGTSINSTTFEEVTASNEFTVTSTINASKLTFTWDADEADKFQIVMAQYDSTHTPYKISKLSRYSSNPITDGAVFDTTSGAWNDPGSSAYTAISGGSIEINLPTSGIVKVCVRRSSGTGEASSNASFATWLNGGGLTITALV